jgi:uncharacterized protein YihD (DUF1040 family)
LRKKLNDIREMMKDAWEENNKIDIPEFQKDLKDTFDFKLSQFIQKIKNDGRFHELANEAAGHCLLKKMLELKNNL